jgi:hypothetical protein
MRLDSPEISLQGFPEPPMASGEILNDSIQQVPYILGVEGCNTPDQNRNARGVSGNVRTGYDA